MQNFQKLFLWYHIFRISIGPNNEMHCKQSEEILTNQILWNGKFGTSPKKFRPIKSFGLVNLEITGMQKKKK
jgi:hypothetical protein